MTSCKIKVITQSFIELSSLILKKKKFLKNLKYFVATIFLHIYIWKCCFWQNKFSSTFVNLLVHLSGLFHFQIWFDIQISNCIFSVKSDKSELAKNNIASQFHGYVFNLFLLNCFVFFFCMKIKVFFERKV